MLQSEIDGSCFFPLAIPWGKPTAKQMGENFTDVRERISAIVAQSGMENMGYIIEWQEINHRRLGRQRLPKALLLDLPGFLRCTGKNKEYQHFVNDLALIRKREPQLESWLKSHAMEVVRQAGKWPKLLAVLTWFKANPRPDLYLRQLNIPGVDSKFIERNKKILRLLLDEILPDAAISSDVTTLAQHGFERRYGLRYDEPLIRMRYLDPSQRPHQACFDISLPLSGCISLYPPCSRVIITENKINGLTFPDLNDTLIIFGLGYGIETLKQVAWLHNKKIFYWGDIDTHGFAILSQLRSFLPHTRSFLMDKETLMAHRLLWGKEEEAKRCTGELSYLSAEELSLYNDLKDNIPGNRIRLEQERIDFAMVQVAATQLR